MKETESTASGFVFNCSEKKWRIKGYDGRDRGLYNAWYYMRLHI